MGGPVSGSDLGLEYNDADSGGGSGSGRGLENSIHRECCHLGSVVLHSARKWIIETDIGVQCERSAVDYFLSTCCAVRRPSLEISDLTCHPTVRRLSIPYATFLNYPTFDT